MLDQSTQSPWTAFQPRRQTAPERTVEIEAADSLRLMLVDDDPEDQIRMLTAAVGGGLGNFVDYVSSGKDAIRALRRPGARLPDIVLLETCLHDIPGRDVLRWIKSRHPQIAVIGLSNYASPDFVRKLYAEGLSCFMRKPFTIQGFLLALGVLPAQYGITLTRPVVG